ncbi:MAG: hypothetical protein H0V30_04925 [Chitinophagaceae bacterium]|nr:hypothetical protein [Chitinophagaceae bacterium]
MVIFSGNILFAQQDIDSNLQPEIYDTAYFDNENEWVTADTIFNKVSELAYPADLMDKRVVPNNYIDSLKKNDAFWYADLAKNTHKDKPKQENISLLSKLISKTWFRTLVWIFIVVGFLSVLIWYLAFSNISIFKRASKTIITDNEDFSTNIFEINYKEEIENAIASNNFRLAIRLLFLQLLKQMDDNNIIQYKQDLTNLDYRMQLYGSHYSPAFNKLVKYYEYSWYGKWQPQVQSFIDIREQFENFYRQLKQV